MKLYLSTYQFSQKLVDDGGSASKYIIVIQDISPCDLAFLLLVNPSVTLILPSVDSNKKGCFL